jgi:aspartokinase/homoserine dehydrogenase 1
LEQTLDAQFQELTDILHGVDMIRECSKRSLDLIMSFGERMSCAIITQYLISQNMEVELFDPKQLIITNDHFGSAQVLPETYGRVKDAMGKSKRVSIVPGFIGATEDGVTTTLGRDGSDYTASLIGAGAGAEMIEIWTDVDGVLSADPRSVKNAFVIPELSYQEAMELSYFGAKVIHPSTMLPAIEKDIPILIKNTLNPERPGSLITKHSKKHKTLITGIASIENVALINIEGAGMIGIPGIAARILGTLAKALVNVVMISQASSEHSICLVFKEDESQEVRSALEKELEAELSDGRIEKLDIKKDLIILAVIGENMHGTPGISGKLFSSLGEAGINVLAIAQGSSERNISLVASGQDREKALKAIHRTFLEQQ